MSCVNPQTSHTWKHLHTVTRALHDGIPSAIVPHLSALTILSCMARAGKPRPAALPGAGAAERTRQNAGRDCRGWAGRWQCRAGHRRRSRGHGRQLIQGYSSWMLPAAAEPEGWSTARTLGCATLQMDNFPPAAWVKQSTESTWLHNISLMPEEFAEPANDAVLLDWRWYFFIVLEVMSMHQECRRKTQIVMRGSERLWLN